MHQSKFNKNRYESKQRYGFLLYLGSTIKKKNVYLRTVLRPGVLVTILKNRIQPPKKKNRWNSVGYFFFLNFHRNYVA